MIDMNVMLDLETMGHTPDAAIIAIGAVGFDIGSQSVYGDKFYMAVDLESSVADGGVMSASTVKWWLAQSDDARRALLKNAKPIRDVLTMFSTWLALISSSSVRVWGNGATFDNVIIRSAYGRAGIVCPWSFRDDMCYRTVKNLHPKVAMERSGTHHNALDDAESQARHLMRMLARSSSRVSATASCS